MASLKTDLRLVVPEPGYSVVDRDAVQPQLDHLAGPAPGRDERLPDVLGAAIGDVGRVQQFQIGWIGQGFRGLVGEGAAPALREFAARGQRPDDRPVQPDLVGPAGFQRPSEDLAEDVEGAFAGDLGDDRRLGVVAGADRGQPLACPTSLVGDELPDDVLVERGGVVAVVGCRDFQERAQLLGGQPHCVEVGAVAGTVHRPQLLGEVVPEQVAQPPLRYEVEVELRRQARIFRPK